MSDKNSAPLRLREQGIFKRVTAMISQISAIIKRPLAGVMRRIKLRDHK
jgi:hypothetical protein